MSEDRDRMNDDTDSTQDQGMTTGTIAAGAETGQRGFPVPADREGDGDGNVAPVIAGHAASGHLGRGGSDTAQGGSVDAGPGTHGSLLEGAELQAMIARWKDIQGDFVDDPGQAVEEADVPGQSSCSD